MGAPLEDARGLAQRYSRMRHEAEILVCTSLQVSKFQLLLLPFTLILLVCSIVS